MRPRLTIWSRNILARLGSWRDKLLAMPRWHKVSLGLVSVTSIVLLLAWWGPLSDQKSDQTDTQKIPAGHMRFVVRIPVNTPPEDSIYIHPQTATKEQYKMQRQSDFAYSVDLNEQQLLPTGPDGTVRYRYVRNGNDFRTAEYLELDTDDYFWTQRGRKVQFAAGQTQTDTIMRWRWFPPGNEPLVKTTQLAPSGQFLPRVKDIAFRSGQIIEDFYTPAFDSAFTSTAQHLKKMGYSGVEIDPPWQWTEENGLPKVKNLFDDNPNYPSDAKLIEEIKAYKQAGLKVTLGPQLCCTQLNTENRSADWWNQYFAETTDFLVHFAKLAESSDVDSLHYAVGSWEAQHASRWRQVFQTIKQHFSGEVGQMVWNSGSTPGFIIPDENTITWGEVLDYFYIAIDTPISTKDEPTDDELKAGADTMLDGAKKLYDKYQKPVFVRTTYFKVKQTWRGNSFYNIASVPWYGSEEKELANSQYQFGSHDQARVVNAFWRSIAERSWVIGYAQFGYSHWENPLAPDLSVRGQPAEDLWRKWNAVVNQNR